VGGKSRGQSKGRKKDKKKKIEKWQQMRNGKSA
jgi:hypothetical protein